MAVLIFDGEFSVGPTKNPARLFLYVFTRLNMRVYFYESFVCGFLHYLTVVCVWRLMCTKSHIRNGVPEIIGNLFD